jgi:pimeloyl-ACP methyl ester carboxylesterase
VTAKEKGTGIMSDALPGSGMFADLGIHVDDQGAGEPVVFLHSSGMSGDQWRRTAEHVRQSGARTIVPDLLGSGRSAPWPTGAAFGFLDDVAIVDRLLQRLATPVHLVAHSYGGFIALRAAALDPVRIRSIALYDPVAFGVLQPGADAEGVADLARVRFGFGDTDAEHEAFLRGFVDYWGGEGAWARLRDPARAEFLRVGWVVHEGARSLSADTTPAEAYRSLQIPALLMTGETSPPAARAVIARLGATLPSARVVELAGAGHMGPLTHGKQLNELLSAHLAAVPRRGV